MSSPSSVKLCNGCGEVMSGLIYEVKKHRDEPTFAVIGVCCIRVGRHSIYPTCYLIPHDTLEELLQAAPPSVPAATPEPAAPEPAAEPAAAEPVLTEAEEDKILPKVRMPSFKFCSEEEAAKMTKIYKNGRLIKAAWNRVVKDGIRENINSILEDCRHAFTDKGQFEELTCKEVCAIIKDWPTFCRKVYAHLKANGSFLTGDECIFGDFEDTAGGCDEIVWDAACEIINKKGMAPLHAPVPVPAPAPLPLAVVTRAAAARIASQADADQAAMGH
jgi:hypothetical protein